MTTSSLLSDLEDLTDDLADLEDTLSPLLTNSLPQSTKKLPLLDKAKLYVTTVYAIESLLFSYLKLNGASTQNHPLTTEINRVKTYFAKLRSIESSNDPVESPAIVLNKAAANRIVTHALSGQTANQKIDFEAKEREEREKALKEKLLAKKKAAVQKQVQPSNTNGHAPVNDDLEEGEEKELSEEGEVQSDGQHLTNNLQSRIEAATMDEEQYFASKNMHKGKKRKSNASDGLDSSPRRNKKERKAEKWRKSKASTFET